MPKRLIMSAIFSLAVVSPVLSADETLAPTGTLRAVYLAGNRAQAVKDPNTGEISGVAAEIARGLASNASVPLEIEGVNGLVAVIEAISEGRADIGFLAPDPSREGKVVFSQAYLRNPQGLIVPPGSPIRAVTDLKTGNYKIAATRGDSIALFLSRNYPNIELIEVDDASTESALEALRSGDVQGFAANHMRLSAIKAQGDGLEHLDGDLSGVAQAIVVSADRPGTLEEVNAFIENIRDSGQLQEWIIRADNGTVMEPSPTN